MHLFAPLNKYFWQLHLGPLTIQQGLPGHPLYQSLFGGGEFPILLNLHDLGYPSSASAPLPAAPKHGLSSLSLLSAPQKAPKGPKFLQKFLGEHSVSAESRGRGRGLALGAWLP